MENLLYYGDNLDVMKRHIKDESVDLVYLDPPFNSKLQLFTITDLLTGKAIDMPPIRQVGATFKKAEKVYKKETSLDLFTL